MNVRTLATDLGFTEGPVITREGSVVVTSIDRGHVYAISPSGVVERLASVGGGPNGATEGPDGSIYVAQNGGRSQGHRRPSTTGGIQRIHPNGMVTWTTTDPISPNDLCFGPDGLLYCTDPTRPYWRSDGRLWRTDVVTGETELLTSTTWYPNGIGFSQETDAVYVASTLDGKILRIPIVEGGLGRPEVAIQMDHGMPDGFAFDTAGHIVIGAVGLDDQFADIQVWSLAEGKLVDSLRPSQRHYYTNVALGRDRRLVICDSDGGAVLEVDGWPYEGLPLHPFRT
jgi:gluconolactonase